MTSAASSDAPRRLWDKGAAVDQVVHRFTVEDDPHWDLRLVEWDCLASAAHARTLHRAALLDDAELAALLPALAEIHAAARSGQFEIPPALEDCHTAIEAALVARCATAGERIHTGRSRNDQVSAAMRLYLRDATLRILDQLDEFIDELLARIQTDGGVAMPGFTHLQPAMPSSVGQWLHAFAEAALQQLRAGDALLDALDACPLGTGAGFGVPLPLDRRYTAALLGFSRVQRSPIDVQFCRGRLELGVARLAADIGAVHEKLAWDMVLFTSSGYAFFGLPDDLTTGSSIMPQKRNPDVCELLRARAARLRARCVELEWITGKLPSSYHRDLQLTKEPVFRALDDIQAMLAVAAIVVERFTVRRDALAAAMTPELFATHAAYDLVRGGVPFRQAYRQIAARLQTPGAAPLAAAPAPQPSPEDLAALTAERAALTARRQQRCAAHARASAEAFRTPA
ncbi:MAG: Argininosuccinate lyase [Phycisphaerae bacterium]|nr:Argininosuccinate lyase [Phycisphaerae bacterium]